MYMYIILYLICLFHRLAYAVYMLEKIKRSSEHQLNHIILYDIACSYTSASLTGDMVTLDFMFDA